MAEPGPDEAAGPVAAFQVVAADWEEGGGEDDSAERVQQAQKRVVEQYGLCLGSAVCLADLIRQVSWRRLLGVCRGCHLHVSTISTVESCVHTYTHPTT